MHNIFQKKMVYKIKQLPNREAAFNLFLEILLMLVNVIV
jgi:hypothetical protein